MCELLHTVRADQTCSSVDPSFGAGLTRAECTETAHNWVFQARRLEVPLSGEPACALRVGRAAGRLDSEQFRSAQKNSGLPQGLAYWLGSKLSVRQEDPVVAGWSLLGGRGKVRHEAARIHYTARRCRHMAAASERAADAEATEHRVLEPDDGLG